MGRKPIERETRTRAWREGLHLSDVEAATALDLSPDNGATRLREWERGKGSPSAPTLGYMTLTEAVVEALVLLRSGRPDDAKRVLHRSITAPLRREVARRAPGVEAVGPADR